MTGRAVAVAVAVVVVVVVGPSEADTYLPTTKTRGCCFIQFGFFALPVCLSVFLSTNLPIWLSLLLSI